MTGHLDDHARLWCDSIKRQLHSFTCLIARVGESYDPSLHVKDLEFLFGKYPIAAGAQIEELAQSEPELGLSPCEREWPLEAERKSARTGASSKMATKWMPVAAAAVAADGRDGGAASLNTWTPSAFTWNRNISH